MILNDAPRGVTTIRRCQNFKMPTLGSYLIIRLMRIGSRVAHIRNSVRI